MIPRPVRIGVLVSGHGTNLQALIDAVEKRELEGEIVLVISNRPQAPALSRASRAGIPHTVLRARDFSSREAFDAALADRLSESGVELVVLAGFMHFLSPVFLDRFPTRIVNLHPSLLPDDPDSDTVLLPDGTVSAVFRGIRAVEQALAAGVRWTGCSVHLVTAKLDAGPVLAREAVPILPGDTTQTLHARIQEAEHRLLPAAVADYAGQMFPFC